MFKLPGRTGMWEQNNRSDVLGSLFSSFNLDLTTKLGVTKVSPRTIITTNGISNLGCPVAFKQFSGKIYTVAGSYVFINPGTKTETAFAQAALGGDPTDNSSDYSDLEIYSSKLWTAGADTLRYTDGASWGKIDTGGGTSGLTSTVPHKLMAFLKTNRLYVTDGNRVRSTDGSSGNLPTSGQYSFTLSSSQSQLNIVGLLQTSTLIWILTINPTTEQGYIITWDGITADTATDIIPLDSRGVVAGIILKGTPHIITLDGRLQYHNGQVFVDARNPWLPVSLTKYLKNPLDTANDRWMHPNGIAIVNGRINILVNNENYDSGATINESLPSGIWEYDEAVGWYHKSSLTQTLAADGIVRDYGQNRISRTGALANLRSANNSSDPYVGTLLIGANYFSDASTAVSAIWTNDSLDSIQKAGYLVTVKVPADPRSITDAWNKLFAVYRRFVTPATDRIIFKYRNYDTPAFEGTITWTGNSSFRIAADMSLWGVGDEVEITQGSGGGLTSRITSMANNSGTYTIAVDESYPNVTGTSKARFQHWIKCGTIDGTNVVSSGTLGSVVPANSGTGSTGDWIQVKACIVSTGNNELLSIIGINKPLQTE